MIFVLAPYLFDSKVVKTHNTPKKRHPERSEG